MDPTAASPLCLALPLRKRRARRLVGRRLVPRTGLSTCFNVPERGARRGQGGARVASGAWLSSLEIESLEPPSMTEVRVEARCLATQAFRA